MLKIIIVDDSRIFRKMLKAYFVENGHEVIGEAGNGEEALELLKNDSLTIEEIALSSGFSDANYFSKAFKKKNNLSPNEYKTRFFSKG